MKKKSDVPNCVPLRPGLEKSEDDPCWDNYVMLGMKPKSASNYVEVVEKGIETWVYEGDTNFPRSDRPMSYKKKYWSEYLSHLADVGELDEDVYYQIERKQRVEYGEYDIEDIKVTEVYEGKDGDLILTFDAVISKEDPKKYANTEKKDNEMKRQSRFSEGPEGTKEFEKWLESQPKEVQEDWEKNKKEVSEGKKAELLPIKVFRELLAKAQNQEVFESGSALSGVDPSLAKYFIEEGKEDGNTSDDVIKVNKGSTKATKLKPSQTTMVPINSVGMGLAMINGFLDTDLGAIIASDGQIMDGHHRWAGAILAYGGKAKVGGYFAKLPGKDLVRVLNTFTKGKFNRSGKPGQGNISDFKPAVVKEILEDGLVNGVTSTKGFHTKPEMVEKALFKLGNGDVDLGIKIMSDNASKINKAVPSWAPKRKDMPVIEPNEVPEAAKYMSKGLMDWAPPYKNASRRRASFRRRG